MTDTEIKPQLEHVYQDADGRKFVVEELEPTNQLGREIRGRITFEGKTWNYTTSNEIFARVWIKDVTHTHREDVSKTIITGEVCNECGGMLQRTGSCMTCVSCGETTGCG